MSINSLTKDEILRVGVVSQVNGRIITIKVGKNKNLSDIFLDGNILRNISVNSFIEIRKGFLSIIGKVEGEKIEEEFIGQELDSYDKIDKNRRYLTVSLIGYIGLDQKFTAGTKELPLIGNEAYIVTKDKIDLIHNLVVDNEFKINVATTDDEFDIEFPIDTLFNGHIAIFGNTGSGKSNTLATLYEALVKNLQNVDKKLYSQNTQFIVFDFNGEYIGEKCITPFKKVYNLSTRNNEGSKLPLDEENLLDLEMLSILSDATEKNSKTVLKRTLSFYTHVNKPDSSEEEKNNHFKNIMKKRIIEILGMSDKIRADLLIDYVGQILPENDQDDESVNIRGDLEWHNGSREYFIKNTVNYLKQQPDQVKNTIMYKHVNCFKFEEDRLANFIKFLYLQLISDVLSNRAQNDHVSPMINRIISRKNDIMRVFDTASNLTLWQDNNFIVINLNHVNLEMKKTLPLLLCRKIYSDHKQKRKKSLNIIIDEAHNILSRDSFREAESWKDYRLETFEEIIKEGRKFGVFVTISSQRPSDISPTITSQAHNYFIHRLINRHDLAMISSAVSYIDRITEEYIPTLPTGTCIFSGVTSHRPIKVHIKELADDFKPHSQTLQFKELLGKIK